MEDRSEAEGATQSSETMDSPERKRDDYYSRLQVLAGDFQGAIETANSLPNVKNQVACLLNVAEAQAAHNDVPSARATIEVTKAAIKNLPEFDGSSKGLAISIIAEIQARKGDITGALATANRT